MNPLAELIARRIRTDGPLSVAEYMTLALGHPEHGYYMRGDPFGRGGDFITAPEVSQMFGELIGLWTAACWQQADAPADTRLVELGPGRGTLCADALRALTQVPDLHDALHVDLIETSAALRECQRAALAGRIGPDRLAWHDAPETVPAGPVLVVANEFFDALPIHQLQRRGARWHERRIGLDASGAGFAFMLDPQPSPLAALLGPGLAQAPEDAVAEVAPAGIAVMRALAQRIAANGIAALIVDYGHGESAAGATLQAVRGHRYAPVLEAPGEADLTAHVDFAALARVAREAGCAAHGPVPQGVFLERLGIDKRAETLRANATDAQRADIDAAQARLIDAAQMGTLFKAMALTRADAPVPAGFEG